MKTAERSGRVDAVLVATDPDYLVSRKLKKIQVLVGEGVKGDKHAGRRLSDVRDKDLQRFGIPKDTEVANHRQFSAVSAEELEEIARNLDIPRLDPGLLGENLVLSGIPNLSMLPAGTKLFFRNSRKHIRTAVLVVWEENTPCRTPGEAIGHALGRHDIASRFAKAAYGLRGVVGSVYCSGTIHVGDEVVARLPPPPPHGP